MQKTFKVTPKERDHLAALLKNIENAQAAFVQHRDRYAGAIGLLATSYDGIDGSEISYNVIEGLLILTFPDPPPAPPEKKRKR